MGQPNEKDRMPHQPVLPLQPFQKWGLDFVGPFKPTAARTDNQYVIVVTDYYRKCVEAKALRDNTAASMTKFLYKCIVGDERPSMRRITRQSVVKNLRIVDA